MRILPFDSPCRAVSNITTCAFLLLLIKVVCRHGNFILRGAFKQFFKDRFHPVLSSLLLVSPHKTSISFNNIFLSRLLASISLHQLSMLSLCIISCHTINIAFYLFFCYHSLEFIQPTHITFFLLFIKL